MTGDNFKVKPEEKVAVSMDHFYTEIDRENSNLPWGAKCLLINRSAGVMYEGVLRRDDPFPTHFAPVPRFRPTEGEVETKKKSESEAVATGYLVGFYHASRVERQAIKSLSTVFKLESFVFPKDKGFYFIKFRSPTKDLEKNEQVLIDHYRNYGLKISSETNKLQNYPIIGTVIFPGV